MGKSLKGKELGVGICQRKDGVYIARFTQKNGKRIEKHFIKYQECRNWLATAQEQDENSSVLGGNPTLDEWFKYWIDNIKIGIRDTTRENYMGYYRSRIKPFIGEMRIRDIKPLHCTNVLAQMSQHSKQTVKTINGLMHSIFADAQDNGLITNNPVKRYARMAVGRRSREVRVLNLNEQKEILALMESSGNNLYLLCALILETGLRIGEAAGLQWSDIDMDVGIMHIQHNCIVVEGKRSMHPPKSESGERDIPLTQEALRILKLQKEWLKKVRNVPREYSDFVFLTARGNPLRSICVDILLKRFCDSNDIEPFHAHTLRHTFATRCIEAGMQPKILQTIMGHSTIATTMNLYVHPDVEGKINEMKLFEEFCSTH